MPYQGTPGYSSYDQERVQNAQGQSSSSFHGTPGYGSYTSEQQQTGTPGGRSFTDLDFTRPGQVEDYWTQNSGIGSTMSNSEAALPYSNSQVMGPSNIENYYANYGNLANGVNLSGQAYGQAQGALGGESAQQAYWESVAGGANANRSAQAADTASGMATSPSQLGAWLQGNGQFLNNAGVGEQYGNSVVGQYGGAPTTTDYSGQTFNTSNYDPNLSANMDPYYDNAQRKSLEALNQQAAARGMYGSSYAMDQNSEAITNLRAQQAKDEAQYGLSRSAELRGWQGLKGEQASAADAANRSGISSRLGWLTGMAGIASNSEAQQLARLQQGQSATSTLDAEQLARANALMGYASEADQNNLRALQLGLGATQGIDSNSLARQNTLIGAAGQADTQRLAGLTAGAGIANQADTQRLNRSNAVQNYANQADTQRLNRYNAGLQGASAAQQATMGREQLGYTQSMGLSDQLSSIIGTDVSGLSDSDLQLLASQLNLDVGASSELYGQYMNNRAIDEQNNANTWSTILNGAKAVAPVAGAIIGGVAGGPPGAVAGYGAGKAVSSS